jgi:dipeptidyl aminopeptidase/acylaminoacyl peptidase
MTSLKTTAWPVLAALMLAPLSAVVAIPAFAADSLIPRADIFGNPTRTAAQVSPDGKWMTFLAPRDGVLNVWIAPFGKIDEAKPITNETKRPIRQYFWMPDSSYVVYLNDVGGDENFLLFRVDPATGENKNLTDFPQTRAFIYGSSWDHPENLIIGLNNRDPKWHDVYDLNVKTGELKLVHENKEEYDGFYPDEQLVVRYATKATADGGQDIFSIAPDWTAKLYTNVPSDDAITTAITGLTADGKTLYMTDTRGRDKGALMAIDTVTGNATIVAESDKADVGTSITEPLTGRVLGYNVDYVKSEWHSIDESIKADIDYLNGNLKGQWAIVSQTKDNSLWIVVNDPVTEPVSYYAYDRGAKSVTKLFTGRPNLEGAPLSPMYGVEIPSRDGKTLVSYLTLPRGTDADGDGKPETAVPMVLNVHGGPWGRDSYGYDPEHQWLANRGYAVLSVNFRASTGFGKSFTNAGDREWGAKMHDDLLDAVKWAVDNGITPADKVAIYGGSYGGYATLAAMTFTPTQFACGVDIVGPSNLITLINTIPPYWESGRQLFYRRIGNPTTPEGAEFLKSRSPLTKADQIQRPLLIAQGANDPRVKKAESDQIVAAMKAKNIPVTYVLYPDEGHGFARAENRTSFYAVSEAFLSQCLGGQFEPVGSDFKNSSIEVPEGTEHVPGLKEALATKQAAN